VAAAGVAATSAVVASKAPAGPRLRLLRAAADRARTGRTGRGGGQRANGSEPISSIVSCPEVTVASTGMDGIPANDAC
jgi:hypothetical protein